MESKFTKEFNELSNYKFSMIKFSTADYRYDKETNQPIINLKFNITAKDLKDFSEEQRNEVLEISRKILNGFDVSISYIKVFADEQIIKNKIMEFLNKTNYIIFKSITEDNIQIVLDEQNITIDFTFETPQYLLISSNNSLIELEDFLDASFTQMIHLNIKEIPTQTGIHVHKETIASSSLDLGLINIDVYEKVYRRRGGSEITEMAKYIANVRDSENNCVICGKVSDLNTREYTNKKYDSNDSKSGPQFKKLISFFLNDTTGRMACVAFPDPKDDTVFQFIKNGDQIAVKGKVGLDRNQRLQLIIDTLSKCKIDYSSIKYNKFKQLPSEYMAVKPEEYIDMGLSTKTDLFDNSEQIIPSQLIGKTYVIFDLETTGTLGTDEIVEIGACKMVDGKIIETFQTLVKPTKTIPDEVIEITHITNQMVEYAPSIDKVLPDFLKFIGKNVLVGHNVQFDISFVEKAAKDLNYEFSNDSLDTLALSKETFPDFKSYKLVDLSKKFSISHLDAHRALSDVFATADLFRIITKEQSK